LGEKAHFAFVTQRLGMTRKNLIFHFLRDYSFYLEVRVIKGGVIKITRYKNTIYICPCGKKAEYIRRNRKKAE
jgi:hypothetical protein